MTSTAIPSPKGETLTLRQAAERLMGLASKIERASSEDEENRLCDERDALLAMMRKADALLSTSSSEDVRSPVAGYDQLGKSHYCIDCNKRWFGDVPPCDDKTCPFRALSQKE